MNKIDATIIEVLGQPYQLYEKWCVDVKVEAEGVESKSQVMGDTPYEAEAAAEIGNVIQI